MNELTTTGWFGYISAYDAKRHMARVRFPDKSNLVSAWIPVAVQNSKKNKDEIHLDIGEHVYCNMLGNGMEVGVVLCSIWDGKNQPSLGDPDVRRTEFEDGTALFVDRKNHVVEIKDSFGSVIRMADGDITIKAAKNVYIN
jgi:phage baseplate assembly protein gpV